MNEVLEKNTIKILDKSLKQGFTAIPRVILKASNLTMQAKVIFSLLLDYAWQKGSCFPGQDRLARDLSVHKNTIIKHLNELKDYGLISWKQRGLNRTNIYYINSLSVVCTDNSSESHPGVIPESHSGVTQDIHPSVNIIEEDEYKKKEYKKPLTLGNANGEVDLNSFDGEAIALSKELNDEKSIRFYQKIINQRNRGEISDEDIQSALADTKRVIRTDQVDGTTFLKNPAGWFVSVLKKLIQKNEEKQKQEKYNEIINKFKESFIAKSQI
jgi:DNA-binding transcriptional regulator YhcF (GntR family)